METGYMTDKWVINRIGLVNFWFYDEEEFHFSGGRLLLRGSNGSGKSVTMQSFIPLLLDGNKSPERLDPFGSRARRLENYVLPEEDRDREENTGYLYMEFKKESAGNYLTIGMGLRARRNKPMQFWGFSITDGRRIGVDFQLYKDIGEKIPLTKTELRNRLENGGEVTEYQKEYMEMVNKLLFGFESLEEYDELIKLLIQLRTPKLSKEFKPSVIYEIMENSLQPLSDEDLRPMSEAIENMDTISEQLEMLKNSRDAAVKVEKEYDRYNEFILFEKAKSYETSHKLLDDLYKREKLFELEINELTDRLYQLGNEQQQLIAEKEKLEHKKEQLEKHDSYLAKKELEKVIDELENLSEAIKQKEKAKEKKNDAIRINGDGLNREQDALSLTEKEIYAQLDKLDELAYEVFFHEQGFMSAELKEKLEEPYSFDYIKDQTRLYREKIKSTLKALDEEQNCVKEYDESLKKLDEARKDKDTAARSLEKYENLFQETREEFIETVHKWDNGNTFLKLKRLMQPLSRDVQQYGRVTGYNEIISHAHTAYRETEEGMELNRRRVASEKEKLAEEKNKIKIELEEWKSIKDPEPEREEKVRKNREHLKENGIPHIPFYMAVDFADHVPEQIKGRLEEALNDMGILDALIVSSKHGDKVFCGETGLADKYLNPNPQFMAHTLSELLKPVQCIEEGITCEEIDNILKSILLDPDTEKTYLDESGHYRIGLIEGCTSDMTVPKFIGAEARKRFRLENINRLEKELSQKEEEIEIIDVELNRIIHDLEALKQEFQKFPRGDDLEESYRMVKDEEYRLENCIKDLEEKGQLAEVSFQKLKKAKELVIEAAGKCEIPLKLQSYREADDGLDKYRNMLGDLIIQHNKYINIIYRLINLRDQQEELLHDLDDILYDLGSFKRRQENLTAQKVNYENTLKELGHEEIEREIDNCIRRYREVDRLIPEKATLGGKLNTELENRNKDLEQIKQDIIVKEELNRYHEQTFLQEYKMGYVTSDTGSTPYNNCRTVLKELKQYENEQRTREEFAVKLQEVYNNGQQFLLEYNVSMQYLFEEKRNDNPEINRVVTSRRRLELTARLEGRESDFYTLMEYIDQSIEQNEKLLLEEDRHLFEDILINTVGKKIRARIYHSERWIGKINTLMQSMNTSSGLSFSLSWRNKTAENEEQMGTRELVELLKSDAALLDDSSMMSLTTHFRSKIKQARTKMSDEGQRQNFHLIMKEILDYRKWFEFQLYFKKTGENRRELTNNAFFIFSGGEKAMAMYAPLFSAVYARYENARNDCPRMISLDEAFAGVDDINILDMFRLLEELKLNFIINSQNLWGDYETVPSLSICELLRPNNADFVTVIRYHWNGKIRSLVSERNTA
mgnify:FL=1